MDVYTALKFIHVTAVIIWLGGVSAVSLLTARLSAEQDQAAAAVLARQSLFFGRAVIFPAAIVTLLAGMATAGSVGISFGALWITWGFIAIIGSVALGATLIRRASQTLATALAEASPDAAQLAGARRRLALWNTINVLLLFSAVWAMVAKPTR